MNKTITDTRARELVELFLDGATTIEQERQLYGYFAAGHAAADLEPYGEMFRWFDSLEPATAAQAPAKSVTASWVKRWWLPVAASVAVVVTAGLLALEGGRATDLDSEMLATYEGSYMIVNGQKCTDVGEIIDHLQRAERYSDSICRANEAADVDDQALALALSQATSPAGRQAIIAALSY
jgi:hypothetical protein